MKLAIVLTNDWELFGDGSGNYFEIQHKPLENLLEVITAHGAKLTVMAEVAQQWAFKKIANDIDYFSRAAFSWEALVKKTIELGSDVQLHLHPQWLNARWQNGKWKLNFDNWATSNLEPELLEDTLINGKKYLEDLLKPINRQYECIAFRAGAYCIQPSKIVIDKLIRTGFVCDSSVQKGLHNDRFYDYRDASSNVYPWFVDKNNIKYSNTENTGLIEFPIYSFEKTYSALFKKIKIAVCHTGKHISLLSNHNLSWQHKKKSLQKKYPSSNRPFSRKSNNSKSFRGLLSKIITIKTYQLNYDSLTPKEFTNSLIRLYKSESSINKRSNYILPVIATGHVKNMPSTDNIMYILEELAKSSIRGKIIYCTLSEVINSWLGTRQK